MNKKQFKAVQLLMKQFNITSLYEFEKLKCVVSNKGQPPNVIHNKLVVALKSDINYDKFHNSIHADTTSKTPLFRWGRATRLPKKRNRAINLTNYGTQLEYSIRCIFK